MEVRNILPAWATARFFTKCACYPRGGGGVAAFGGGSAAEEWPSHENVLAAGILGCGQHEASKIMFLNLMCFHVFSFSLGVLYGPEKLGWIREMFLFLTCCSLPNAGHYPGSFLLLKYGHLQALRIFLSEKRS